MNPYNAEAIKRHIQKLKDNNLYDDYKKKRAQREKDRRNRLKDGLTKLPNATRDQILKVRRENCKERVRKWRQSKKINNIGASSDKNDYRTSSALTKAVAKVKKALPSTPTKRKAVVMKLLNSFDENDKRQIIENDAPLKGKIKRGLSKDLMADVREFYERDDISRMSPNVRDARKFVDPTTGVKEVRQLRHLMFKLSEVYALFIEEHALKNGYDSKQPKPPLKISKFCELRPLHVKLVNDMPHNVCYCIYHSNFIECCTAIHKIVPQFPNYGADLIEMLLGANPKEQCWLRSCSHCTLEKLKGIVEAILPKGSKNLEAKWLEWVKIKKLKRFVKRERIGKLSKLLDNFFGIVDEFLKHSYIKRQQAKQFVHDSQQMKIIGNVDEALLQIDFAESFTCDSQNEITSAHWNQHHISLCTIALKHSNQLFSKVIASDNTDHSKDTIGAYLFKVFQSLPKTIKKVTVWSDGPSNQFKSRYIAAMILLLESKFNIQIVWNYFAASHGKGCVDGIGAVVKRTVKRLILSRKNIVNCASDFVTAFNSQASLIDVFEMNSNEITSINKKLKLVELFNNAPPIANIFKCHQLHVSDKKIIGFEMSEAGYKYINNKK